MYTTIHLIRNYDCYYHNSRALIFRTFLKFRDFNEILNSLGFFINNDWLYENYPFRVIGLFQGIWIFQEKIVFFKFYAGFLFFNVLDNETWKKRRKLVIFFSYIMSIWNKLEHQFQRSHCFNFSQWEKNV